MADGTQEFAASLVGAFAPLEREMEVLEGFKQHQAELSALIAENVIVPLELGKVLYAEDQSLGQLLGRRAIDQSQQGADFGPSRKLGHRQLAVRRGVENGAAFEGDGAMCDPVTQAPDSLEAGLAACPTPYLVCAPCDSPFLPPDLVSRLADTLTAAKASVAVARTGDRLHPVFSLMRTDELPDLQAFMRAGGRRFESWLQRLKWVPCPFDDAPEAFANINTPEELRAHEAGDPPR